MRWLLLAILVIDLVIVAWLFTGKQSQQEADFVFVCGTAHRRLDPQRMSWGIDLRIAECLFDPLTRIKLPEMVVEPAAAERWQVSEDGGLIPFIFAVMPGGVMVIRLKLRTLFMPGGVR